MEPDETLVVEHFFTNADGPIYAFRNMPPAVQNYFYSGISRAPDVRGRFIKVLREQSAFDAVAASVRAGDGLAKAMDGVVQFASGRNRAMYYEMKHGSSAEGASVFVVSENNPVYATEDQQDFYWPLTTMEFSTRYGKRFDKEHVYWDPTLMASEFAGEAKGLVNDAIGLYEKGFEPVRRVVAEQLKGAELKAQTSTLDSIRCCIPLACHTTIALGSNTRAMVEHIRRLLAVEDNFVRDYAATAAAELARVNQGFFEDLAADKHVVERNRRMRQYARELLGERFEPVGSDVSLNYNLPVEETVMAQLLYPFSNLTFRSVYDKVAGLNKTERAELFGLATEGRESKRNPVRGFETRHLIFEIESGFQLWKDFKRNRMNLRFQQDMRGLAGWERPDMLAASSIAPEYEALQKRVADLMERVHAKHGRLARAVATHGMRKRYLLCMGPRQFTVLTELRTSGEGDRGYREIASRMIELAREQNPLLFGHIIDNYKGRR